MTAPSLHDRLVRTFSKSDPTSKLINPDGPEAAERIRALEDGLAIADDKLRRASVDLDEAADMVTAWSAYADPYFQEKHGAETDIVRLRLASGEANRARSLLSPTTAPAILAEGVSE